MRMIAFCVGLLALYVVVVKEASAASYCRGSIEFVTASAIFAGKIEERPLSTEDCASQLKSIGISKEMIEYISYAQHTIDDTVIVRGMHSSSIAEIQRQLVGDGTGIAAGTLGSAFLGMAAMAGFLVFPPAGLVYAFFLLVSGSATISSGISREQQMAMLILLQTNVLQVDTKARQISQERQSFHSHLDLPEMVGKNNQSFSPVEQYCTWKKFMSMELQLHESYTAQWIVQTSVFRPTILNPLSKNEQLAQATRSLFLDWSLLFDKHFTNQESPVTWTQLYQFWDYIREQVDILEEDPTNMQCSRTE